MYHLIAAISVELPKYSEQHKYSEIILKNEKVSVKLENTSLFLIFLVDIHSELLKLAIHLSFLAFQHVRALFREIANQSLYTSHNITDFLHL